MNHRFSLFLSLLAATSIGAAPPLEREGAQFVGDVVVNGESLDLQGLGIAKYLIYKVYVAGLYLPEEASMEEVLDAEVTKRLELHYLYKVGRADVIKIANKYLAKNLTEEALAGFREKVEKVHALYRDVTPGERCALTYVPQQGLSVAYNGKEVGRVEGDAFANAYLSIWFGKSPSSKAMLQDLQKAAKKSG